MTDDPITLRVATADDLDTIQRTFASGFLFDHEPEGAEAMRLVYEPERWLLACDGDRVIGTGAVLTRDMAVPGAVVPTAHVTGVSVLPTDRRRGALSAIMRRQLTESPEPVAALWASQTGIYRRYGYRDAADTVSYSGDLHRLGVPATPVPGRVREITPDEAVTALADVYAEAVAQRPGLSTRPREWWRYRLSDAKSHRNGLPARRVVVHETPDGTVDGYALWRVQSNWTQTGPNHVLVLEELLAPDTGAYTALWQFLSGLEFTSELRWRRGASPDERLRHLVAEPRQLAPIHTDAIWLRVLDVPAALTARAYSTDLDVVLDITDGIVARNNGRFRLTAKGGDATCAPTADAADLAFGVDVLAGIYLGGRSLNTYASLGEVAEHTHGTVRAASAAFAWHIAPSGIEVF